MQIQAGIRARKEDKANRRYSGIREGLTTLLEFTVDRVDRVKSAHRSDLLLTYE